MTSASWTAVLWPESGLGVETRTARYPEPVSYERADADFEAAHGSVMWLVATDDAEAAVADWIDEGLCAFRPAQTA